MVQGQHEEVLALCGLDQAGAQQRAALKVERLVRLVIGQLLQAVRTGRARSATIIKPGYMNKIV